MTKNNLTIKDFSSKGGKFFYRFGDYKIEFYEYVDGHDNPKMVIKLFYVENGMKYLKEMKEISWNFLKNKIVLDQRNELLWQTINNFRNKY